MARRKQTLEKKTLNFREGDFEKFGEMFPEYGASMAIRTVIAAFCDLHYVVGSPVDISKVKL